MMNNNKTIEVLNKLVEINNDRLEGYETALNETEEHDLKSLFAELARTSHRCRKELAAEIRNLGGVPTEGTKITGKFFRAWMDFKAALTGKDRETIVNSCESGEDKAVETYEEVIKDDLEYLSPDQQALVRVQYELIKADHDTVRSLRDSLAGRDSDDSHRSRTSY
jgi:uncharacterized protein (TIGR02284 family)